MPVQGQDRDLGLFLLGNRGGALAPGQGFSEDDAQLLTEIAGTVAVAIQNARFVQETRRRGEMLRALVAHTGEAIAASSDAAGLMQLFAADAAHILGCPRVAVYAHDETNNLFVPRSRDRRAAGATGRLASWNGSAASRCRRSSSCWACAPRAGPTRSRTSTPRLRRRCC